MSKETYARLFYTPLDSTSVYLQLADQSTRYLKGVATDLLVKVRSAYVCNTPSVSHELSSKIRLK